MPNVVCPSCWTWSELGKRTACKRCGTPLIFMDGRRVDTPPPPPEFEAQAPPPPEAASSSSPA